MVLGHFTVTAAGRRIVASRAPAMSRFSLGLLVLGAYLPDVVDKTGALLLNLPGRSFGHSLIVNASFFGLLALALPARRLILGTVALGVGLHLLEDWVDPVVLLAPLLGPIPPRPHWSFFESVARFYSGGGPQVWLEVAALCYWIAVALRVSRRSPAPG